MQCSYVVADADASNKNLIWKFLGTIGLELFVECVKHLTKVFLHSLKALSSVLLGNKHSTNILSVMVICRVFFSITRQRLCRVSKDTLDKENYLGAN